MAVAGPAATTGSTHRWSADEVLALLADIPDPEIPVVSIAELGMLRAVRPLGDGAFEVVVTPTYSGCPAMEQIADDVRAVLARHGIAATLSTQLAPAWTTDWMTPAARDKLRAYGIAPPGPTGADAGGAVLRFARRPAAGHAQAVPCPRCGGSNTSETSHFGSTACKALYRCLDCLEPFDHFKPY
jgi:ring-1,2-phenylacetyl-CoA epoxidase subunit PaaD